jgi:molybdopterin synthase catalytic subunit
MTLAEREMTDMIGVTDSPLSPESVIAKVRSSDCGCVAAYIGLIRDHSEGKPVRSVEYRDPDEKAKARLQEIAAEARHRWPNTRIAISHRTGILKVGEVNLVIAVAAPNRQEGFHACQFAVDQFKLKLPTRKRETYQNGMVSERR